MSTDWVSEDYGQLLTHAEVCKVLHVSKQKLSSWIRYGKVKTVEEDGETYVSSSEVQDILNNPTRRNKLFSLASEAPKKETRGRPRKHTLEEASALLMPQIQAEIERIVKSELAKQKELASEIQDVLEDQPGNSGLPQSSLASAAGTTRELVGPTPYKRPNVGSERFPLYL